MNNRYIDMDKLLSVFVLTMSMGAYDEEEHERRERQVSTVDTDSDDERTVFHGTIEYNSGDSTEELLDTFQKIKSK